MSKDKINMIEKLLVEKHIKLASNIVHSHESYTRRCCLDPVGMGIAKDNGDGTISFIRPKPHKEGDL